jgi:uncharacterized protein YprB with RNaseH-like and TPR domain
VSWVQTFQELLPYAACIDIETCHWNGPIAVVGIYRPKEGVIEVTQLVRGQTLSPESLRQALQGVRLIITFNGNRHDLPKLEAEFGAAMPAGYTSLDLFEVAQSLQLKAGLKLLEGQFGIERPDWQNGKRRIAVQLWKLWNEQKLSKALESLLDYNREDAVNLYFLARRLAEHIENGAR